MPAEFIDLLNLPELDIGHSKKVLFTSDHFHTWVHGDYPGTKRPHAQAYRRPAVLLRQRRVYISFPRRLVSQAHSRYAGDDPRWPTLSARQHRR